MSKVKHRLQVQLSSGCNPNTGNIHTEGGRDRERKGEAVSELGMKHMLISATQDNKAGGQQVLSLSTY